MEQEKIRAYKRECNKIIKYQSKEEYRREEKIIEEAEQRKASRII